MAHLAVAAVSNDDSQQLQLSSQLRKSNLTPISLFDLSCIYRPLAGDFPLGDEKYFLQRF
jgi:hypothetical protein